MTIEIEPGSFKDPQGGVFFQDGAVRRWLDDPDCFYSRIASGELIGSLVGRGRLVAVEKIPATDELRARFGDDRSFFSHERIPFLSYPYEWPPAMVRAAGLFTLEMQEELLGHGLSLKDATPFNVQFKGSEPVFIDFGSIEPASRDGVWIAYNQFVQCFLTPLLLWESGLRDLPGLYQTRLDGVPLEEAVRALGLAPGLRHRAFLDYLVPALLIRFGGGAKAAKDRIPAKRREIEGSAVIQTATVRRLKALLGRLRLEHGGTPWSDYAGANSYETGEHRRKMAFVSDALAASGARSVLDLGANTGDFSLLAAEGGRRVAAVDFDESCLDRLFHRAREVRAAVTPLRADILNPSPALGWGNRERASLLERIEGRFDAVLGLALVHHLLVTGRVPLGEIAALFARTGAKHAVVEFVAPEDRMFAELTRFRRESYAGITREAFEAAFAPAWRTIRSLPFEDPGRGMARRLYFFERT